MDIADFNKTWKKAIATQVEKNSDILARFLQLVEKLNNIENARLIYIQTPKLEIGKYQYPPVHLQFCLVITTGDKSISKVPKETQKEFLNIVNQLSEEYEVMGFQIGFRIHKDASSFESLMLMEMNKIEGGKFDITIDSPMMVVNLCLWSEP